MKVLVTGANGFLGKQVCLAMQQAGHHVIGMDLALKDVACDLPITTDITKPLPKIGGLDVVVHLAAIAAPRDCERDPNLAFDVNVNGTLQVLRMALESGARKVVFSSSAHVYGVGPRYLPTDETHPLSLGNTYTTTKILGEALCGLYHENHGLSYTILRLYNAYGAGQKAGYFLPDMMAKARNGALVLQGGSTTKDWVHVSDVARAFVLAIGSPFVGAVNIGTGKETGLVVLAEAIAKGMGAKFDVVDDGGYGTRMCADIGRAKRVLGWTPSVGVMEGLDAILFDEAKTAAVLTKS